MAPTTTRTRLTDQEKMKICEEKKKPGFSIEKIMKDYSISRTGVYKILREKDEFTPAKVFTQSPARGVKSRKKLQHADLDAKLLKWLEDSERTGLFANGQKS